MERASYGPDQLKARGDAFDDAWSRISPFVSARARAVEAARLKLAGIVLGLANNRTIDPRQLADTAVRLMQAPPQKLRP